MADRTEKQSYLIEASYQFGFEPCDVGEAEEIGVQATDDQLVAFAEALIRGVETRMRRGSRAQRAIPPLEIAARAQLAAKKILTALLVHGFDNDESAEKVFYQHTDAVAGVVADAMTSFALDWIS